LTGISGVLPTHRAATWVLHGTSSAPVNRSTPSPDSPQNCVPLSYHKI